MVGSLKASVDNCYCCVSFFVNIMSGLYYKASYKEKLSRC